MKREVYPWRNPDIDKIAMGTCPSCTQLRGSLWKDRRTGCIIAPCIKCRREGRGLSPLAAGITVAEVTHNDHDENLVLDRQQSAGAVCVVDLSRAPYLASIMMKHRSFPVSELG